MTVFEVNKLGCVVSTEGISVGYFARGCNKLGKKPTTTAVDIHVKMVKITFRELFSFLNISGKTPDRHVSLSFAGSDQKTAGEARHINMCGGAPMTHLSSLCSLFFPTFYFLI